MKLSSPIHHNKRKLHNILIDVIIQNGAPKSNIFFCHILCAIVSQYLIFIGDERQPQESPFSLLSESESRIEKSYFYQELWLFENSI